MIDTRPTEPPYDSTDETERHIDRVRDLLFEVRSELRARANLHDASKLQSPEKETFDRVTPLLRDLTYGSDEYKATLAGMKPALDHHYGENRHHPEHYENGVCDMSLIDLLEMLADWKAATERHNDGSLQRSLEINEARFKIPEPVIRMLRSTAKDMGWL